VQVLWRGGIRKKGDCAFRNYKIPEGKMKKGGVFDVGKSSIERAIGGPEKPLRFLENHKKKRSWSDGAEFHLSMTRTPSSKDR